MAERNQVIAKAVTPNAEMNPRPRFQRAHMLTARWRGPRCIREEVAIVHHCPVATHSREQTKLLHMRLSGPLSPVHLSRSSAYQLAAVPAQQSPIIPPTTILPLWSCQKDCLQIVPYMNRRRTQPNIGLLNLARRGGLNLSGTW